MASPKRINLNLSANESFNLFAQSFRRVKYFLFIADNISISHLPQEHWEIGNKESVRFAIPTPPSNKIGGLVEGFQHFQRLYLVRDSIETFALCLDDLCFKLLLAQSGTRHIPIGGTLHDSLEATEKAFLNEFKSNGVSPTKGKISKLKERFSLSLSEDIERAIGSLKNVRDCLSHRNGIVSEKDGEAAKGGLRRIQWPAFELFVLDHKTKKRSKLSFGTTYINGGTIELQMIPRAKVFSVGEKLEFTSAEVFEIAQALNLAAQKYLSQIQK
ncbi:hypothetical protein [uncultured Maritalea sp.]|uniref:hypothetical protein n=1 Tax=uncultured Maritalea sp. TaxID=757249 RepID=UPI00262265C7|nr:hypothetical protein [uncultured Maritalea sp.]